MRGLLCGRFRVQFSQGAKKIIFTACHLGKLKLAFTSPDVISTSPKSFVMSRILLLFEFPQKITWLSGKLKTEFTSPKEKSTSPGLSDTNFLCRLSQVWPQILFLTSFLALNTRKTEHWWRGAGGVKWAPPSASGLSVRWLFWATDIK